MRIQHQIKRRNMIIKWAFKKRDFVVPLFTVMELDND